MRKLAAACAILMLLTACLSCAALAQVGNVPSLSTLSKQQSSGVLQFKDKFFYGGQKLDVYSGPGYEYYRGANGRARASTDEEIQIAGMENGWILVKYPTSDGSVRVGYVNRDDLKYDFKADDVSLLYQSAKISQSCYLCDDPVLGRQQFAFLPSGTIVTYLASYTLHQSWAYVELFVDDKPARGFVPANCITF